MAEERFPQEELQRITEDLEDLKAYIEELSAFLPLAICTINPVGIIIDVNRNFEELTGYISIEVVGEDIASLFLERRAAERILNESLEKGTIRGKELTLFLKGERKIPVSISVSIRKDKEGNFIGYFLSLTDITEIKKYQEDLEEQVKIRTKELEQARSALLNILEDTEEAKKTVEEERNKTLTIINHLTDGLLVFDAENKLSLINPQAEKFFNVRAEDLIGKSVLELSTVPELGPLMKIIGEEIKAVFREELPIREDLTIEISTGHMLREKERVGALVIMHDVTREKRIEKMKTEFVSVAAHQLRTPLSAIKWTVRMLLDGDLGEITEEQRNFIEKLNTSNERMINLINDLLDVARIEEGKYLYKPIPTDIESVIQSILSIYQKEIERKKIKFGILKPEKKLPQAMLDVEKISLAVQNLIDNAIRYTPTGGLVTIILKSSKGEIEVAVKDTGIGIPKNQQERIFTKFFRGANAVNFETDGTGLGLFIAKNIIEAHGGRIWFESEENKGTTFYFTIPVQNN